MHLFATIAGILIIAVVLLDAFETVVLPRRVQRSFRLTSWFYRHTWRPWTRVAGFIPSPSRRESFLSYFGPLSILLLLLFWAAGLIFGFALLQFGAGGHVQLGQEHITFGSLVYLSGETFFTLGLGDITPVSTISRALTVLEGGMGFAFLGIVIGYLPTVYSAFRRARLKFHFWMRVRGRPPALWNCSRGWVAVRTRRCWTRSSAARNAGQRRSWKAIFPIPC